MPESDASTSATYRVLVTGSRDWPDDGSVWAESSDEREVRRITKAAPKDKQPARVQRHMRRTIERWEDA